MTVCPSCGCEIDAKPPRRRSTAQNAYWHGVIVAILADHCGYTADEMHDTLKSRFLGQDDLATGLRKVGSTKKLSTSEFSRLIDEVRLWSHQDLGVYLPAPNEADDPWLVGRVA